MHFVKYMILNISSTFLILRSLLPKPIKSMGMPKQLIEVLVTLTNIRMLKKIMDEIFVLNYTIIRKLLKNSVS